MHGEWMSDSTSSFFTHLEIWTHRNVDCGNATPSFHRPDDHCEGPTGSLHCEVQWKRITEDAVLPIAWHNWLRSGCTAWLIRASHNGLQSMNYESQPRLFNIPQTVPSVCKSLPNHGFWGCWILGKGDSPSIDIIWSDHFCNNHMIHIWLITKWFTVYD